MNKLIWTAWGQKIIKGRFYVFRFFFRLLAVLAFLFAVCVVMSLLNNIMF